MKSRFFIICLTLFRIIWSESLSSAPIGLAGGGGLNPTDPAYAALISSNGSLSPLSGSGFPSSGGFIQSVSMNNSGNGLIGGLDNSGPAYAALVSQNGVLTQLLADGFPLPNGTILSVSINNSGLGLIGGATASGPAYGARVLPNGTLLPLSGGGFPAAHGVIFSVKINNEGVGLIGGKNVALLSSAYAARMLPDGTLIQLSGGGFPSGSGQIFTVAINETGNGLIGGNNGENTPAYAARMLPDGTLIQLSGEGFLAEHGGIIAVALNNAGIGLIGGSAVSGSAYAARMLPNGTLVQLSGEGFPTEQGEITAVALNNAGVGLIGGVGVNNSLYAAFVSPSGELTQVSGLNNSGLIFSVAINDAGVGLIGGAEISTENISYLGLVSPIGIVTRLSGSEVPLMSQYINSVALLNFFLPTSFGPGNTFANSLFAFTDQLLPNHLFNYKDLGSSTQKGSWLSSVPDPRLREEELTDIVLASSSDRHRGKRYFKRSKKRPPPQPSYRIWVSGFGEYAHQKKEEAFPALNNWLGGVMLGFDYTGIPHTVIGGGSAYASNSVHLSEQAGHAFTNQEFLTLYGLWNRKNFFLEAALWAGIYQMDNKRNSFGTISSKAHVTGWILNPHLHLSTPFYGGQKWFTIDPFVMIDWASNWQGKVEEEGASGFNLIINKHYMSILRSEVGLRFFETLKCHWGDIIFEEKGSYINKTPFQASAVPTAFVSSISSFNIELFSNKIQNLGSVQFFVDFVPQNKKYPYGSINYQGEFGSSFQSHLFSLEIGKVF